MLFRNGKAVYNVDNADFQTALFAHNVNLFMTYRAKYQYSTAGTN